MKFLKRILIWLPSTPHQRAAARWRYFVSTKQRENILIWGRIRFTAQSFAYGGAAIHETGYQIDKDKCIGCQGCRSVCPAQCISKEVPREIDRSRCLHCGNCFRICPVKAVQKLEETA